MVALANFFVLIPLYVYPGNNAWQPLFNAIGNNTALNFKVVVNPASGPGLYNTLPDSNYIANVAKLSTYSNVDVLGYVYASYGLRSQAAIQADIVTYNYWGNKSKNITLDGIFFDQVPVSTVYTSYISNIATYTRNQATLGNEVYLNPGGPAPTSFYSIADYINAYEAPQIVNLGTDYANHVINVTIPAAVKAQSSAIVYGYTNTTANLKSDVNTLFNMGMGGLFFTSYYEFQDFSPIFSTFISNAAAPTS